jgi:hypothetical protein
MEVMLTELELSVPSTSVMVSSGLPAGLVTERTPPEKVTLDA